MWEYVDVWKKAEDEAIMGKLYGNHFRNTIPTLT